MSVHGRGEICQFNSVSGLRPEWAVTIALIMAGCCCLTANVVIVAFGQRYREFLVYTKWVGFAAGKETLQWIGIAIRSFDVLVYTVNLFCVAAVIFPIGFSTEEIGGAPYQLPNSYQVGIAYIFFVMALWVTVISELFASRVCLPHF